MRRGFGPRSHERLRGVHPKERHFPKPLRSTRLSPFGTTCPFLASRDPVDSASRCGYRTFLKGRTDYLGTWDSNCTRQFLRTNFPSHS